MEKRPGAYHVAKEIHPTLNVDGLANSGGTGILKVGGKWRARASVGRGVKNFAGGASFSGWVSGGARKL